MGASSSDDAEWNIDDKWSSQGWKSGEMMEVRTGRRVVFAQHTDRFIIENDNMDSYGADQQRLQISDSHFDKFPRQQHSLVGR